jgi:hypothetical protein
VKINDIVSIKELCDGKSVKVVRHKETKFSLNDLLGTPEFERYQNGQSRDVFANAKMIISFIAGEGTKCIFAGIWEIIGVRDRGDGGYIYDSSNLHCCDDLVGRLIVEWGDGARSWVQWLDGKGNKDVVEILPVGDIGPFIGYYDVLLDYGQLVRLVSNKDSNRSWYNALSSVAGIYLILDSSTGRQYIGSAYGYDGIWGRWSSYARECSGGNVILRSEIERNHEFYKGLRYSIVRVLEPGISKDQVVAIESINKRKFGSRSFGLNDN